MMRKIDRLPGVIGSVCWAAIAVASATKIDCLNNQIYQNPKWVKWALNSHSKWTLTNIIQ